MKRIISLIIVLFIVTLSILPITTNNDKTIETKAVSISDITYKIPVIEAKLIIEEPVVDLYEIAIQEMQADMTEINKITNEKEWFIAYKDVIDKYSHIIAPTETIYDYFTEEELDLLFRVVQAEVGDEWEFMHKVNVANVIFNRLHSDERDFAKQDTLSKVLCEKQFCTIRDGRYMNVEVSELTILACEYAFLFEDTTEGALFFDNNRSLKYQYIDNDGAHNFYKIGEE